MSSIVNRVREEANKVEGWVDQTVDRATDRAVARVQTELQKHTPWIILLYVLLGVSVVFSILTFVKVNQLRCAR